MFQKKRRKMDDVVLLFIFFKLMAITAIDFQNQSLLDKWYGLAK